MATVESRIAHVGIAKQTAKGTPTATPLYSHGLRSGSVHKTDITQDLDEQTALDINPVSYALREGGVPGFEWTSRINYLSAPLYYYGLLGAVSTTGAGPYTHVITPAASPPYFTVHGRHDTFYTRVADTRIDEIGLSWEGVQTPEMSVKGIGTTLLAGTTWTATNDESANQPLPTVGGTFSFAVDSGTPASAPIAGGSIVISRNVQPVMLSKQSAPDDAVPTGPVMLECTLKLIVADLNEWREIVTGDSANTALADTPLYGSFLVKFLIDSTKSLQIDCTKVAFMCDFPEANPTGGPTEITVVGKMVKPAAGAAVTVTGINATASL